MVSSKKRVRLSIKEDDEREERGRTSVAPLETASSSMVDITTSPTMADDANTIFDRATRRAAKKALEQELQWKIPTHDDDGIPYGKIQLRRMKRRVKHGLSPIPSEEEEREIRERERREKMEEEALYYEAPARDDDVDDDGDCKDDDKGRNPIDEEDAIDGGRGANDVWNDNNEDVNDEQEEEEKAERNAAEVLSPPPAKKVKRNKPVPPDYVCQACQSQAVHWIYDCPKKETKKGCNTVAKKLRGLHDPPSRKVFVGGLPFDCDEGMVKRFFDEGLGSNSSSCGDGVVVHVKLLKFEDSQRCKGQAFLTFDTDEGAAMAITKMNGLVWREVPELGATLMTTKGKKKKKTTKEDSAVPKRELRLKVTRALNRFATTGPKKAKTGEGGFGGHANALKRIGRKSKE